MALIAVWVSLALDFRLASPETAASVVSFLAVTFDLIGSISAVNYSFNNNWDIIPRTLFIDHADVIVTYSAGHHNSPNTLTTNYTKL